MGNIKLYGPNPKVHEFVHKVFPAFGTADSDVKFVMGRLKNLADPSDFRYGKPLRHPSVNKLWVILFGLAHFDKELKQGEKFTLEILDQNGTLKAYTSGLEVRGKPQTLQINSPPDGTATNPTVVCPTFIADGTTNQHNDPLNCKKMDNGNFNSTGVEMYRENEFWGVEFVDVDVANGYTLSIYHNGDCTTGNGDTSVHLNVQVDCT